MGKFSILIGQFLLGLYFLLPGIRKFTHSDEMVAYMQSHDIPFAPELLLFAGAVAVIGGLLLMSNRYVKLIAYGFVIYVLLVNVMLHNFWAISGDMVAHEMQNFIKNLAIMAGLLALAGYAPSRGLSLDGWWKSDKSLG